MTHAPFIPPDDFDPLHRMPTWVSTMKCETPEAASFSAGAALCSLQLALNHASVPQALLRDRLALRAAETCLAISGRSERAGQLRDEVHLLHAGDQPGPAGIIYLQWRQATARRISIAGLHKAMPQIAADDIALWLGKGKNGDPIVRASAVLETVLAATPYEESVALILADTVLAQALGWPFILPFFANGLKPRDLRKTGPELTLACHHAVGVAASLALRQATDLSRRAVRLHAIAPKLRAKAACKAIEVFLTRDAVSPSVSLGRLMSDRAARRLCDRLVQLGVVQELTGRPTFRLYGL
ncbi:MAG: DUF1403 family protein [Sulfitobacter sp.]